MNAQPTPQLTHEAASPGRLKPPNAWLQHGLVDGRYELLSCLGSGGFARVYEARHGYINRRSALKVLDPGLLDDHALDRGVRERFLREAQVTASIDHPSVISIYDFGLLGDEQLPYMAMELLEGCDLEQLLFERRRLLRPARALRLFKRCLEGLAEAHRLGIVHRDIKPSNIFYNHPGTPTERFVLLDFGVAGLSDEVQKQRLTATGQLLGTPAYLAPEFIEAQVTAPSVDIYQMGLVLVELLDGEPLVNCANPYECLRAHLKGTFQVPAWLEESPLGPIIARALATDPAARYATALDFLEALEVAAPAFTALPELFEASRYLADDDTLAEPQVSEAWRGWSEGEGDAGEQDARGEGVSGEAARSRDGAVSWSRRPAPEPGVGPGAKDVERQTAPGPTPGLEACAAPDAPSPLRSISALRDSAVQAALARARRHPRAALSAMALLIALLALVAGQVLSSSDAGLAAADAPESGATLTSDESAASGATQTPDEGAASGATQTPDEGAASGATQTPDEGAASGAAQTPDEGAEAALETHPVLISSQPPRSEVVFEGVVLGITPIEVELPARALEVTLRHEGHASQVIKVTPAPGMILTRRLTPQGDAITDPDAPEAVSILP